MFDHLSIEVADLSQSLAFYDAALAPLKMQRCFALPASAAYGPQQQPRFWLYRQKSATLLLPPAGFHLALQAESRAAVDAFYQAAIAQGGSDDGRPGLRPHYHPNYYAAFVIDLDGYRLEAVCHTAPEIAE